MPLIYLVQLAPHPEYFPRVDGYIARLTKVPARRLVHHYRRVRETVPFSGLAAAEKKGAHGGRLADADGAYGGRDVGHCVVDCEAWVYC